MRILLITSQYPPQPGGGGIYCRYLCDALCSPNRESGRCDVAVLTSGSAAKQVERHASNLWVHRGPFSRDGKVPYESTIKYGINLCRTFRPDIIHGQHFDGVYVATQLKASLGDTPVCATFHKSPTGQFVHLTDPQMAAIISYSPWVDTYVPTCNVYRRELNDLGIPAGKVSLIWPGVDNARLATSAAGRAAKVRAALATMGIDLGRNYDRLILCPARLDPSKDLETFVRAASILKDKHKKHLRLAFLIAGASKTPTSPETAYRRSLEHLAQCDGLRPDLFFIWMKNEDMPAVFRLSSICVLPSVREALGLVLLESFAVQTPVIVANVPGVTDVVGHESNGLLFAARDHAGLAEEMDRAIRDDSLRKYLIKMGRETVIRRFGHLRMKRDHVELYMRILGRSR